MAAFVAGWGFSGLLGLMGVWFRVDPLAGSGRVAMARFRWELTSGRRAWRAWPMVVLGLVMDVVAFGVS
ncbi:hypothetical protein AB0H34_06885 [Saccharopolyspora shandongensis]|uniref:hypothetical protein n=1 Tax=Saccharopolyspora shandongensis TaxID=418495 RepID=UPI0033E7C9ED